MERRSVSQREMSFLFYCTVNGRLDVNVALNRPSFAIDEFSGSGGVENPASNGNDGDKTLCDALGSPNSVVVTFVHSHPWYVVDLGVALWVAGVNLTNRVDDVYGG